MASQNDGIEPPIYIESFQEHRRHWYNATDGDAVHRLPVRIDEIWNEYSFIGTFDDPAIQALVNNGDATASSIVTLRKNRPLALVPGTTHKYQTQAPDLPIAHVIVATKGQKAPLAGNVGPVTTATAAPSGITGYTPVIVDSAGTKHPMQASRWIVDGINSYVEFPYGVPSTMIPPFAITYYEYTGVVGGGNVGAGEHVWHYEASAIPPNWILCPDPAYAGAVLGSHFIAPINLPQDTEASGSFIMFTGANAGGGAYAFRAGTVSGTQWALASRGQESSVTGGFNNIASSFRSFVGGGQTNRVEAALGVVCGGDSNVITGQAGFAGAGDSNTVSGSNSVIVGGSDNTVSGTQSVVAGGNLNVIGVQNSFIGGGVDNSIPAVLNNAAAAICGGSGNALSGAYGFVGGGQLNSISVDTPHSAVMGGQSNTITAVAGYGVVGGGENNTVTAGWGVIAGGAENVASGTHSAVPGGFGNTAGGAASLAAGLNSTASNNNCFVWSDSTAARASTQDNQAVFGAAGGFRAFVGTKGAGTEFNIQGDLTVTGIIDPVGVLITGQSSTPLPAPAASSGDGTYWVSKDSTPSAPVFSNDAGEFYKLVGQESTTWVVTVGPTLGNLTGTPVVLVQAAERVGKSVTAHLTITGLSISNRNESTFLSFNLPFLCADLAAPVTIGSGRVSVDLEVVLHATCDPTMDPAQGLLEFDSQRNTGAADMHAVLTYLSA